MSELNPCHTCQHPVADSAAACPNCGANLEEEESVGFSIVKVVIFLALVIVIGRILYKISVAIH